MLDELAEPPLEPDPEAEEPPAVAVPVLEAAVPVAEPEPEPEAYEDVSKVIFEGGQLMGLTPEPEAPAVPFPPEVLLPEPETPEVRAPLPEPEAATTKVV